MRNMVQTSARS